MTSETKPFSIQEEKRPSNPDCIVFLPDLYPESYSLTTYYKQDVSSSSWSGGISLHKFSMEDKTIKKEIDSSFVSCPAILDAKILPVESSQSGTHSIICASQNKLLFTCQVEPEKNSIQLFEAEETEPTSENNKSGGEKPLKNSVDLSSIPLYVDVYENSKVIASCEDGSITMQDAALFGKSKLESCSEKEDKSSCIWSQKNDQMSSWCCLGLADKNLVISGADEGLFRLREASSGKVVSTHKQ